MDRKVWIVDEHDEVIGKKLRSKVTHADIARTSAVWVVNSNDEILLARRSAAKKFNPNQWGPAAAGTVEITEDYTSNAVKELEEELGVRVALMQLNPLSKKLIDSGKNRYFMQWFSVLVDTKIENMKFDTKEVSEIKWFSKDELLNLLRKSPEIFEPAAQHFPL